MSKIYYAIQITTDQTSLSDSDYGLTDGIFRFITGRPDYDGTPTYPTYEDGSDNTHVWYEGLITADGLGKSSRTIDISTTGQYGTLSGFNFSLVNHSKFMEFVNTNNIRLIGRSLIKYVVIDDVFYQAWQGICSNAPFSEKYYTVSAIDDYKKIHKPIPPKYVNPTAFSPGQNSQGDTIPVTLGKVPFAQLKTITRDAEYETLAANDEFIQRQYVDWNNGIIGVSVNPLSPLLTPLAAAISMDISSNQQRFRLLTPGIQFTENELAGKYLVVKSGERAPIGSMFEIAGNSAVSKYEYNATSPAGVQGLEEINTHYITLKEQIPSLSSVDFNKYWHYNYLTFSYISHEVPDYVWWFSIVDLQVSMVLSNDQVNEIYKENGSTPLWIYSDSAKEFRRIDDMITSSDSSNVGGSGYPGFGVFSNQINSSGELKYLFPIAAPQYRAFFDQREPNKHPKAYFQINNLSGLLEVNTNYGDNPIDFYTSSYIGAVWQTASTLHEVYLDLLFPLEYSKWDFDELYAAVDIDLNFTQNTKFSVEIQYVDPYNHALADSGPVMSFPADASAPATVYQAFSLPERWYLNGERNIIPTYSLWDRDDNDANGNQYVYREYMKIGSDYLSKILDSGTIPIIRLKFQYISDSNATGYTFIRSAGFIGEKTVSFEDGNIYARVDGETVDSSSTDNVYNLFRKILQDYDGIPVSSLDYGNLPTERVDWQPCGRQILERKNSYEYLNELCEQSFVGMFPTRTGKRKLVAWLDSTSIDATFSSSNILRDSIGSYERTNPSKIYNDFFCQYGWSVPEDRFTRSLIVTKTDSTDGFPAVSGDWQNYVMGVSPNSYADASSLFKTAHDSYDIINYQRQNPKNIQDLHWFLDNQMWQNQVWTGANVDDPAYKYLQELIYWTSLQKEDTKFSVALDSTSIRYELLQQCLFSDSFYTNSIDRTGWITSIEIDPANDKMDLQVTMTPRELQDTPSIDTIIERGTPLNDAYDMYNETGSADTVTES